MEDEYFARREQEKRAALAARLKDEKAAEERQARQVLHYHKCGKCGMDMETRVFRGVEIEICPECGAVLLDPGELEALAGGDKSGIFKAFGELFVARHKK